MDNIAQNQVIRILQLTDFHLFGAASTNLLGVNTYNSLQQVISLVTKDIAKKAPELLVLTGDISQDYSAESYKLAKNFFCNFAFKIATTMGNHDFLANFINFFGDPTQNKNKIFTLNNWRIIILNSYWPEHIGGKLAEKELEFLSNTLINSRAYHIMIFLHHPVLPINSIWLNKIITSNAQQFLEIIDQFANIKAVVCGHVHQEVSIIRSGVQYLTTPSTSLQFKPNSPAFKLDTLMPGYRWFDLYDNGTFKTKVKRIAYDSAFIPILESQGY
jgi:3',5'-cyclic-AMP phosphodiesterase